MRQPLNLAYGHIVLLVFFFFTLPAFALPEDSEQPIHVTANSSQFNYKTGINTYEGDVKIDQGTQHVTADRVVTNNNEKHKIEAVIAYGIKQLAVYTSIPKKGDLPFQAKGNVIKFYPAKSTIMIEGNVLVTQGENSFQGPLIIYNTKTQVVTAPPSTIGRASITIKPE